MGKSFELLGLAAFNTLLGLILAVTFFTQVDQKGVDSLSEEAITSFIQDMSAVASGKRADLDEYAITSYLMDALDQDSQFKSTISYTLTRDNQERQQVMEMDRMKYISQILGGLKAMQSRNNDVKIEYIKIEESGESARVLTTNMEQGVLQLDDGDGNFNPVPVSGTSYCEQTIILQERKVKLKGATCMTDINFSQGF